MKSTTNKAPVARKALKGQPSFGQVNRSALKLNRAKSGPITRTGQSASGRIKAHGQHYKKAA